YGSPATHDLVDGAATASCAPASGTLFDLGATTVTCHASDARGNAAIPTAFTVHVNDTIAPAIEAHGDETAEADNASGAIVTYAPPTTYDAVDGDGTAHCAPATGSLFAIGVTNVTCDATDGAKNAATPTSFEVRVRDATAPAIDAHAPVAHEADNASGAVVTYAPPATHDAVDGDDVADCVPASGSL